ncbi:hypothetical protein D3C83_248060 [compost metagenome]
MKPLRSSPTLFLLESCLQDLPVMARFNSAGSVSNARYMLEKPVSPPSGGTSSE